jgi:integrase
MPNIKEYIKDKRPSLSDSSITTYSSVLKSLYKKVYNSVEIDYAKFDDADKILDFLKDQPPNKRKTLLSALVIITDNKKFRDQMLSDVRDYNKEISKQEKTESQEENWVSQEQVETMFNDLKKNAGLIYKKDNKNGSDLQVLQNFIILALFKLIAPRRSKDYCDFKIKNIDKEKDNYIDKGKFIFNSYKTAKTYGKQEVPIPKELTMIINKWIKINPTDYLLFDVNMNPLSSVKLNQRFNKMFDGKKTSVNMLRHSFLTEKFGDAVKKNDELSNTMTDMGSSAGMAKTYVKNEE